MNVWLIIWIVAIVAMLIVEALTLGLTTIWFAGGAVVAAILSAVGAPVPVQIIAFLVISLALLYFTRPIVQKYFNKTRTMTNAEGIVGKHAYVKEQIDNINATGVVKIDGLEWSARSEQDGIIIPVDALVEIKAIDGVKAIVKEIKEADK